MEWRHNLSVKVNWTRFVALLLSEFITLVAYFRVLSTNRAVQLWAHVFFTFWSKRLKSLNLHMHKHPCTCAV